MNSENVSTFLKDLGNEVVANGFLAKNTLSVNR